jgi:hypothetical protein
MDKTRIDSAKSDRLIRQPCLFRTSNDYILRPSGQLSHEMSEPHDLESLLAAWEAIGPSQPFPTELQGLCLSYFKSRHHDHDEQTCNILAPLHYESDDFMSPPTRYKRQSSSIKVAPPGPARALCHTCTKMESSRDETAGSVISIANPTMVAGPNDCGSSKSDL